MNKHVNNQKYKIVNVSKWPLHKLEFYRDDITKSFWDLKAKLAGEISIFEIALDIATGAQQLWLILNKEGEFRAFLTTQLSDNKQGKKRLNLCQLAGVGGVSLCELLPVLENYAIANGAHEICPVGRIGWQKELAKYGYKPQIFKYKKELGNG